MLHCNKGGGTPFPWGVYTWVRDFLRVTMMSDESDAAYAKLLDASSAYLHLATVFAGLLRKAAESGESPRETVQEGIREYATWFESGGEAADPSEAWGRFAEKWGVPADAWEPFFNTASGLPAQVSEVMGGAGPFAETLKRWFEAPAGGFGREHRRSFRRWSELNAEYVDAGLEYARFLGRANAAALKKIAARLPSFETDAGEGSGAMRKLYDLCVDCGEDAYADLAKDQTYLDAQARVIHALMALRKHEQAWFQQGLRMLHVPGRREFDAVVRRLQTVRRELRDLKDRVEALEERADEQAALRKELAWLRARDRQRDAQWAVLNETLGQLRADVEKRVKTAPAKKASTGKRAGLKA